MKLNGRAMKSSYLEQLSHVLMVEPVNEFVIRSQRRLSVETRILFRPTSEWIVGFNALLASLRTTERASYNCQQGRRGKGRKLAPVALDLE